MLWRVQGNLLEIVNFVPYALVRYLPSALRRYGAVDAQPIPAGIAVNKKESDCKSSVWRDGIYGESERKQQKVSNFLKIQLDNHFIIQTIVLFMNKNEALCNKY